MAQARATTEDFGLVRNGNESSYLDEYIFLVPFAGPMREEADWRCLRIEDPSERVEVLRGGEMVVGRDPHGLQQFAINSLKKAYVVFFAALRETDPPFRRRTEMRLWEMIAAEWRHSGNAPDSLRYVGFSVIVNDDVRRAIEEEWTHQIAQGQAPFGTELQRMLTITPANSITWDRNIFIRTGVHVAEGLSTPERALTLEKAHLIRRLEFFLYMVLEFKNQGQGQGQGQENYRESLIRQLQPMIHHDIQEKQARQRAGEEWEGIVFLPPGMRPQSEERTR